MLRKGPTSMSLRGFEALSPATIWNASGHFGGDPTSNWGLAGRPRAGFGHGSLPAAVKAGRDLHQSIQPWSKLLSIPTSRVTSPHFQKVARIKVTVSQIEIHLFFPKAPSSANQLILSHFPTCTKMNTVSSLNPISRKISVPATDPLTQSLAQVKSFW